MGKGDGGEARNRRKIIFACIGKATSCPFRPILDLFTPFCKKLARGPQCLPYQILYRNVLRNGEKAYKRI